MQIEKNQIPAAICQDRLVLLWSIGFGVTIVVLTGQIITKVFLGVETASVAWCTQNFSPLMASIITKWVGANAAQERVVKKQVFYVTFGLSLLYVLIAIVLLCLSGLVNDADLSKVPAHRIAQLETNSLVLGILLVPLGALISACFGKKPVRRTNVVHGESGNVGPPGAEV